MEFTSLNVVWGQSSKTDFNGREHFQKSIIWHDHTVCFWSWLKFLPLFVVCWSPEGIVFMTTWSFSSWLLPWGMRQTWKCVQKKMQKRNQTMAEFSPEQHQNGESCRHCTFLAWFSVLAEPEGYPFTHQHIPSAHCNKAGNITHI